MSDWRIENHTFKLHVTVPPGTIATVFLPGKSGLDVAAGTHFVRSGMVAPLRLWNDCWSRAAVSVRET